MQKSDVKKMEKPLKCSLKVKEKNQLNSANQWFYDFCFLLLLSNLQNGKINVNKFSKKKECVLKKVMITKKMFKM